MMTVSEGRASAGTPTTGVRPDLLVVRYSEIFLKGENRPVFEACLMQNLKRALREIDGIRVERHHARAVVRAVEPDADLNAALARVTCVFGVASASLALSAPREVDALGEKGTALVLRAKDRGAKSFRVKARRSDKRFPKTSPEINEMVGRTIKDATGLQVDLDDADVTLTLEIGPQVAFVSTHTAAGPGGLPVGVSGNVLLLLSGGIDSPIAGYMCQKRGCRVLALYFHSFPYTGEPAKQKVVELARGLGAAQGGTRLIVIPFTAIQEAYRDAANPRYMVILYRRAMMRIASRVAAIEGALALATGENLGQVASQTLENLSCIEDTADRPVLRPLLAYDKAEIVSIAKRVGTFEISIRPYDDCCSLFVPKHPATKGRIPDLVIDENKIPLDELVEKAVEEREIIDLED
jgi:thiamine biosynthesis protein ThiI